MDTTQIAALVAAGTGIVAAGTGITNLTFSMLRDRPGLSAFAREYAADRHAHERYIEVVAVNAKPRANSVVEMGLRMREEGRTRKVTDGTSARQLPAVLEDGEVTTITWLRQELGQRFWEGEAKIVGCFVVDGRGREVSGGPPA